MINTKRKNGCFVISDTTKKNMSISHIGHTPSNKGIGKGINHLKYILDNIKIKTQIQIANELFIDQSTISKILKRTHNG